MVYLRLLFNNSDVKKGGGEKRKGSDHISL